MSEFKYRIPDDPKLKKAALIDLEENVGVILREEAGYFIVEKYKKSVTEVKAANEKAGSYTIVSGKKSITIHKGIQEGRVWLEIDSGEGGDFMADDLFKLLEAFYNEHF
jgi:hypothetical protein